MRDRFSEKVEAGRIMTGHYATLRGQHYGAFYVMGPCGAMLLCIVGDGDTDMPWEHVSVSIKRRNPNWDEMCFVKDLFWDDNETVMQLHVPKSDHVNNYAHCLHLWKPLNAVIMRPPAIAVGDASLGTL